MESLIQILFVIIFVLINLFIQIKKARNNAKGKQPGSDHSPWFEPEEESEAYYPEEEYPEYLPQEISPPDVKKSLASKTELETTRPLKERESNRSQNKISDAPDSIISKERTSESTGREELAQRPGKNVLNSLLKRYNQKQLLMVLPEITEPYHDPMQKTNR